MPTLVLESELPTDDCLEPSEVTHFLRTGELPEGKERRAHIENCSLCQSCIWKYKEGAD
jgi:hypothetical protein